MATICHVPYGHPASARTLSLPRTAVDAHLAHHAGDYLGPCRPDIGDECTVNADCDDGAFCNGGERCVDGLCRGGAPVCDE